MGIRQTRPQKSHGALPHSPQDSVLESECSEGFDSSNTTARFSTLAIASSVSCHSDGVSQSLSGTGAPWGGFPFLGFLSLLLGFLPVGALPVMPSMQERRGARENSVAQTRVTNSSLPSGFLPRTITALDSSMSSRRTIWYAMARRMVSA